jgi:hypothetical protein
MNSELFSNFHVPEFFTEFVEAVRRSRTVSALSFSCSFGYLLLASVYIHPNPESPGLIPLSGS